MIRHIYCEEYRHALKIIKQQTLAQDLVTLEALYGFGNLNYGDPPEKVKAEAIRQLRREFEKRQTLDSPLATHWAQSLGRLRRRIVKCNTP